MQPSLAQEARQAILLLTEYAFELGWREPTAQVVQWLETYRPSWIRDAVVEALYQGRYKAISVQQILALWQRRGQPLRHATKDFERTIALPLGLQLTASLPVTSSSRLPTQLPTTQFQATPNQPAQAVPSAVTESSSHSPSPRNGAAIGASQSRETVGEAVGIGLDQLSAWDEVTPPFFDESSDQSAQTTLAVSASGGNAVSTTQSLRKQEAVQATLSAIATDRGVLTSAHQPIQPFRPELPFPNRRRYRR
ncbi:MAG: hypothetical protein AAFU71_04955 [Cyanobacteria bacterium J06632_22]